MGYAHYWNKSAALDNRALEQAEEDWQIALVEALQIMTQNTEILKECASGEVWFNGKGEEGCEDFFLPGTFAELKDFQFCKTAAKPYDVIVTAVLTVMKSAVGGALEVSSDGDCTNWDAGRQLAKEVLGREFECPLDWEDC